MRMTSELGCTVSVKCKGSDVERNGEGKDSYEVMRRGEKGELPRGSCHYSGTLPCRPNTFHSRKLWNKNSLECHPKARIPL